jgi:hypothetical protein
LNAKTSSSALTGCSYDDKYVFSSGQCASNYTIVTPATGTEVVTNANNKNCILISAITTTIASTRFFFNKIDAID